MDFQRIWADAVLKNALIHARLGDTLRAATELLENVDTLEQLYKALPSLAKQKVYLEALTYALQIAREWNIESSLPVEKWKSALAAELGFGGAKELTASVPRIPRWLEFCNPPGWPTVPSKSVTLRYSLRIPKRWSSAPHVRGTAREIEHIYDGTCRAEWLIISFMDKATETSDMTNWIDFCVATTGFPVHLGQDPLPALRVWNYLGKLTGVAEKLATEEVHAYTGLANYSYTGLANYSEDSRTLLGRVYIVLARRKSFAWKIALSFETSCFDGMPDEKIYANDHVRAGAILGNLRLGSAHKAKVPTMKGNNT